MKGNHRIYSFDYYAYSSPVKAWNPGFKLAIVLVLLCIAISGGSLPASFYIVLSMTVLNIKLNKISIREYLQLLCIPLIFILLGSTAIALETGAGEHFFRIWVTASSLRRSLETALRAFGAINILYFLTLSTPIDEIVTVLRNCHVPQIITELMSLIYRYIFIMADTEQRIRCAAASRLGYADFKTSFRTFGNSIGSLFVISFKRAGGYYDAMTARCYDGSLLFLEEKKQIRFWQVLLFVLYILSILMIRIVTEKGTGL